MSTANKSGVDLPGPDSPRSYGRHESGPADLDLSRLAVDRDAGNRPGAKGRDRRRKWITRYVLPGAILIGFVGLLLAAAGNAFTPKLSVHVVPVMVKRTTMQRSGEPLFQAAGWIEPRPTSTKVPALVSGIVENLLVVEGQLVKKGDSIARLISIDAKIVVKQAQAALDEADAELRRMEALQRAAQTRFEKPVHLKFQLADAKSQLAKTEREIANLPYQIESAQAQVKYAEKSVLGKRKAGDAIPAVVLQQAESDLASAQAKLRELQKREPSLQREMTALQDKVTATHMQLDLLVEETRQLDEAKAMVLSANASRAAAVLLLEKAELNLERTTVKAPIDGRILNLVASPGAHVSGLESHSGSQSNAVVEMYDPKKLQVRADVRLEDVPLVQPGQRVDIETASSATTIQGRVLQPNSTANIQKNTLEVKVELLDPPDSIRPEMLVTATFKAPDGNQEIEGNQQLLERIFIPRQIVQSDASGSFVWIVDSNSRARKVVVELGKTSSGTLVEVVSGLNVTDKLIANKMEELDDGSMVKVTGEEELIGR